MEIRPATAADLPQLIEIDGTVESNQYLHLDRTGEAMKIAIAIEPRPLRTRLIERNALTDDTRFTYRQVIAGVEEGIAIAIDLEGTLVASAVAVPRPAAQTLEIIDLRVDYDRRRQGLATAMVYHYLTLARESDTRAVVVETRANNFPANQLLSKLMFELSGVDLRRWTNYDMVEEATTLFWYAALT